MKIPERSCWKCRVVTTRLYPRKHQARNVYMCMNCCDLDRGETGVVHYRDGYERDGNPRAQPVKSATGNVSLNCAWCGLSTRNRFEDIYGMFLSACGWGHAGLYIDRQVDEGHEEVDLDYVYKSLGVADE